MTRNSWTLDWPEQAELTGALKEWGERAAESEPRLVRVGYVPPDAGAVEQGHGHLDLVLLVEEFDLPPAERKDMWELGSLPVPAQTLVFTKAEWTELLAGDSWLAPKLRDETVWVFDR